MFQFHSTTDFTDTPCATCNKNCCKEYTTYINAHDIYRITENLHIPFSQFLQIRKAKNDSSGVILRAWFQNRFFDLSLSFSGDSCVFLRESGKHSYCSIHAFKPGVCRAYPFKMDGGILSQFSTKLCTSDWQLSKEFEEAMGRHLFNYRTEWLFYYDLIEKWNSGFRFKRSLKAFGQFIMGGTKGTSGEQRRRP